MVLVMAVRELLWRFAVLTLGTGGLGHDSWRGAALRLLAAVLEAREQGAQLVEDLAGADVRVAGVAAVLRTHREGIAGHTRQKVLHVARVRLLKRPGVVGT